jgi:hypothetical protein
VLVAPGIGPYCPNKTCDVIDNLKGVDDPLLDSRNPNNRHSAHEPPCDAAVEAAAARVETELELTGNDEESDPSFVADLRTLVAFARSAQPPPPEHPLSSGDAIACIGMALQNPDTDEWPQLLRDCMHVIERMEGELLDAKRQRNDESRLRQAAERAGAQYTLRGWISPNPGCAELADHDGGGWEPVYSRSTKEAG